MTHKSLSLQDTNSQQTLALKGWCALPVLTEEEADDIIKLFGEFYGTGADIPSFTLCSPDYHLKKAVFQALKDYLKTKLDALFGSYRLTGGNFYYKAPNSFTNPVPPHQDWTFVDERNFSSINMWIPLTDVNKSNGAYHVIEASDKWEFTYRGSNIPSACMNMKCSFDNLKYVPLKKGEAIIYDHRLIHATPPNISDSARTAVVLNILPVNADLLHCIMPDKNCNKVDLYNVDEEFFWKFTFSYAQNTMPPDYEKIKSENYSTPDYSKIFSIPVS